MVLLTLESKGKYVVYLLFMNNFSFMWEFMFYNVGVSLIEPCCFDHITSLINKCNGIF